ncbi:hypothetical protein HKD42_05220 [Altererythrobacter sp. RZ02]|uniref:EF-hand domain-containing protein n=1 Tax=Pontixanthobacter rizhaonensis TaxID=2730337 RepID=A0A848QL98_9SPHN|nr:hypothetical protein [Pontixanthobacter rizhaonensis]NMW31453.1 hypothetical protein [Pontixanthobacter rizhaonensis]
MNRMLLGGLITLVMVGLGLFWWQGRAQVEEAAPPPAIEASEPAIVTSDIPVSDAGDMVGPKPPEATELSREERRFFRYDRDRDRSISRNEMLSTRSAAFRKLDKDGNNLLTFEEWAVATANRFDKADANGNEKLTPEEFATTRPKRKAAKPACRC